MWKVQTRWFSHLLTVDESRITKFAPLHGEFTTMPTENLTPATSPFSAYAPPLFPTLHSHAVYPILTRSSAKKIKGKEKPGGTIHLRVCSKTSRKLDSSFHRRRLTVTPVTAMFFYFSIWPSSVNHFLFLSFLSSLSMKSRETSRNIKVRESVRPTTE